MKVITIILFCVFILSGPVTSGQIGYYDVNVKTINLNNSKAMRNIIVDYSKNYKQPAQRFGALIHYPDNSIYKFETEDYRHNTKIKNNTDGAIFWADRSIEDIQQVSDAIAAGNIIIIGYMSYDENSYIRDIEYQKVKDYIRAWKDNYTVIVST